MQAKIRPLCYSEGAMEQTPKPVKTPWVPIVALICACACLFFFACFPLSRLSLSFGWDSVVKLLSDVVYIAIRIFALAAPAAVLFGGIGLYQSLNLLRTSRKGVVFSAIGLIVGILSIIAVILFISYLVRSGNAF